MQLLTFLCRSQFGHQSRVLFQFSSGCSRSDHRNCELRVPTFQYSPSSQASRCHGLGCRSALLPRAHRLLLLPLVHSVHHRCPCRLAICFRTPRTLCSSEVCLVGRGRSINLRLGSIVELSSTTHLSFSGCMVQCSNHCY